MLFAFPPAGTNPRHRIFKPSLFSVWSSDCVMSEGPARPAVLLPLCKERLNSSFTGPWGSGCTFTCLTRRSLPPFAEVSRTDIPRRKAFLFYSGLSVGLILRLFLRILLLCLSPLWFSSSLFRPTGSIKQICPVSLFLLEIPLLFPHPPVWPPHVSSSRRISTIPPFHRPVCLAKANPPTGQASPFRSSPDGATG